MGGHYNKLARPIIRSMEIKGEYSRSFISHTGVMIIQGDGVLLKKPTETYLASRQGRVKLGYCSISENKRAHTCIFISCTGDTWSQ